MPGPDPLDATVEQMLTGDEAAFRTVYRAVQPPLLRYLTVLVGSADAEDVASETWAQAFRDLGRFSGDADGFRGWITTIGRNRGLDQLRRAGWKGFGPVPWEHRPNQGFLRALAALAKAASRIGETDEYERCKKFLADSDPAAAQATGLA